MARANVFMSDLANGRLGPVPGGHGGVGFTLLGVLFIATLNNALAIAGVDSFWQGTAAGLVLIAAVAIDRSREE